MATIFVNNPGNLTDQNRIRRLTSMVEEMEHLPESWGPKSTNFFLRDFLAYKKTIDEIGEDHDNDLSNTTDLSTNFAEFNVNELPSFLQWPENNFWRGFLRYKTDELVNFL